VRGPADLKSQISDFRFSIGAAASDYWAEDIPGSAGVGRLRAALFEKSAVNAVEEERSSSKTSPCVSQAPLASAPVPVSVIFKLLHLRGWSPLGVGVARSV